MTSNSTAPKVEAVANGVERPMLSVMIPTFNCASYLRQTLASVMAQDFVPAEMQIEVVDDCSTKDDPQAVVEEVGRGRVTFFRKPKNEGAVANFNTCIERSRGRYVHILHGDDYVLPGFYDEIDRLRQQAPSAALLACRIFGVNEANEILWVSPLVEELRSNTRVARAFYYESVLQFCGVVLARDFLESSGGFLPTLCHSADWEMWSRAVSAGGGIISANVLAAYRTFAANDSGRLMQSGDNIRDYMRLFAIFEDRFEDFQMETAVLRAANLAKQQSEGFARKGNAAAVEANLRLWREIAPRKMQLKETVKGWLRGGFK